MTGNDKFTCAACGETFKKGRPDEEAVAELKREFPGYTPQECAIVCDDCWQRIMS